MWFSTSKLISKTRWSKKKFGSAHKRVFSLSIVPSWPRKERDKTSPAAACNHITNAHSAVNGARHTATMQKKLQRTNEACAKHGPHAVVSTAAWQMRGCMAWHGMAWQMSVKDCWQPKHPGPASDRDSVTRQTLRAGMRAPPPEKPYVCIGMACFIHLVGFHSRTRTQSHTHAHALVNPASRQCLVWPHDARRRTSMHARAHAHFGCGRCNAWWWRPRGDSWSVCHHSSTLWTSPRCRRRRGLRLGGRSSRSWTASDSTGTCNFPRA